MNAERSADCEALVQKVARTLLDTADVHDLGWNNLRTTAEALLPLFAQAWDQGHELVCDCFRCGHENPYTCPTAPAHVCTDECNTELGHYYGSVTAPAAFDDEADALFIDKAREATRVTPPAGGAS